MPPNHSAYLVRLEQNDDLLRGVEKDRLVRLARAGPQEWEPLFFRALAGPGYRMIIWGQNLQKCGDLATEVPVLPTTSCGP
jgi:hypothetical protein